jgi:hypothetical protein
MKNMKKGLFVAGFAMILVNVLCAQNVWDMPDRILDRTDLTKIPGKGETEIWFFTKSINCRFYVYIEGRLVAQVEPYDNIDYKQEKIIVKDGTNVFEVAQLEPVGVNTKKKILGIIPKLSKVGEDENVKWELSKRESIKIKSKPKSNSITVELLQGRSSPSLDIVKTGVASNKIVSVAPVVGNATHKSKSIILGSSSSLEKALYQAGDILANNLPDDALIAILSVSSRDKESAAFVLEELPYVLLNAGYEIVDRKDLVALHKEQDFQAGGEVDDDSAVSIGKLLGANVVITGSISGTDSMRRLRLKALDVKTAKLLAMASEPF